jgi:hypothetical protein
MAYLLRLWLVEAWRAREGLPAESGQAVLSWESEA